MANYDMCEQIAQALKDAPLDFPVRIGAVPDKPDNVACLIQRWSVSASPYFGMKENTYTPLITLTVRSKDYVTGSATMNVAQNLLVEMRLGLYDVFATGMWACLGKDQAQRHIFQSNFKVLIRE